MHPMSGSSTFPLHDRVLDGRLRPLLKKWRKAGISYQEIAFKLRTEHQIEVNPTTVMRWCNEQGIAS